MTAPTTARVSPPTDDGDRIGQSVVGTGANRPEVLQTSQHVEVPLRRKREPREDVVHHLSGAMRSVELVLEEEPTPL